MFEIVTTLGTISYSIDKPTMNYATQLGNIESISAAFTLHEFDNGKVFRHEGNNNITVIVSNDLPPGFNVGFIQNSTGTITIASASGANKRAGGSATSAQYQSGSLVVFANTDRCDG
ncbi:hypothetical protein IVB41_21905 [Bradyrhizobium sp. 44]|uniref:hypothetical protein n=1 Tax=Bradyrhizobium sp. 44 TaxID=2782675 RepID=UPI001FFA92DD|nr:hypothetical protein [Bradyrhizobium sp. 44]MCK1286579.1 hypothetical protein [Bradyrhizobium sp. 44]